MSASNDCSPRGFGRSLYPAPCQGSTASSQSCMQAPKQRMSGCGAGVAIIGMAKAYPRSEFHGYDIAKLALQRAEGNAQKSGVANVHLRVAAVTPPPGDGSCDFITTFHCVQEMTTPYFVSGDMSNTRPSA